MATRLWYGRAHPGVKTAGYSGRQALGFCCVFVAACYVAAIILLVGYLVASSFG